MHIPIFTQALLQSGKGRPAAVNALGTLHSMSQNELALLPLLLLLLEQ
jgi:hypothetical protein